MTYKPPYKEYQQERRKKQVVMPLLYGGLAVVLIAVGITLIFLWLRGANVDIAFLNTPTPTASATATPLPPTLPPTITPIPSETLPPTIAPTATASAPFIYIVQTGDYLSLIAEKFDVDYITIMIFNGMTYESPLYPNMELIIPLPNSVLPTATPLPGNIRPGDLIDYFVLPGDSAPVIAEKFATTVEAIEKANLKEYGNDFDINLIYPGQILKVPVGRMTPTPSPTFGPPASQEATLTPTPSPTPTGESTPTPGS